MQLVGSVQQQGHVRKRESLFKTKRNKRKEKKKKDRDEAIDRTQGEKRDFYF